MATRVSEEKELIRSLQRQADPRFIRSHTPAENARALADELWFLGVIDEGDVAAVAAELEREYEDYFWPFEESEVLIEEESVGRLISDKTPFEEQFVRISTANGTATAVVDPPVVLGRSAGSLSRKRQKKSDLAEKRQLAAALAHLGVRHLELRLVSRAIEYLEQALQLRRAIGDRRGEGNDLGNLGVCHHLLGDIQRAIEYFQQTLAIQREIGDRQGEGSQLGNLGLCYEVLGQVGRAIEYHEQALVISREIGDRQGEGNQLGNLGLCYEVLGEVGRAIDYHEQALAISREIGDRQGEGSDLFNLGVAFFQQKRFDRALACWLRSTEIFRQIQSPDAEKGAQNIANLRQQLGKEAFARLEAEVRRRLDEIIEEILAEARQALPPQE